MGLPADLATITVTGFFSDGAGNPQQGAVTFTPSNPVTDQTGKVIIGMVPVIAAVGSNGSVSQGSLVCTDNANLQPQGWWWVIGVAVAGAASAFSAYLPSTLGSSADLSVLTPEVALPTTSTLGPSSAPVSFAQQAGGLSVPFVSSLNGQSGQVTAVSLALGGVTVTNTPSGSGKVLTSTSGTTARWQ